MRIGLIDVDAWSNSGKPKFPNLAPMEGSD